MNKRKKVFLGMSGGVDSSLSAALLQDQGYEVIGVYMKNWSRDLPGMHCPWADDLADAKRVAVQLGIDFRVFDFESEYKHKVVDYMLAEFRQGRTPNPDIMCNQEIKFKLFYEVAHEQGADLIATGHYAQIIDGQLTRATDENKDQTYFLYRINQEAINHTLFPIGHLLKPEVKRLAAARGLANAYKKESMGVCFVGEVGIRDFLREYIDIAPGPIIDADSGKRLGTHEGAVFYTIGQRHGLNLGGGLPYYVVRKDVSQNIVYVSKNLNHSNLWTTELELEDVIMRHVDAKWSQEKGSAAGRIAGATPPSFADSGVSAAGETLVPSGRHLDVRLRHRAPLVPAVLIGSKLIFDSEVKRPAPGQSAVFYDGCICLGGGIIN